MYTLYDYSGMFADKVRMAAYTKALKSLITPESVLIDLGAGSGIFSLIACQMGARKVYAIDPNPCIQIGKELSRVNGFDDRIEWIQEDSRKVELTEKADILLSDIRGALPFTGENLSIIADARDRLLKEEGHLLPLKDTLYVALVENKKAYKKCVNPWQDRDLGLDLSPLSNRHAHRWAKWLHPKTKHIISEPEQWAEIDYKNVKESKFENTISLTCSRDATSHGFYVWFDAEISSGIGFSGGPGKKSPTVYGNAFFPWPKPVQMKAGDSAEIHLAASLVEGDYLWRWNTNIRSGSKGGNKEQTFKQSTFHAEIIAPPHLSKRSPSYTPRLTEDGELEREVLQLIDGDRTIETIARDLMRKFPERFSTPEKSLAFVGDLSNKFSQD